MTDENKNRLNGLFLDDERFVTDVTWKTYPRNIDFTIVRNKKEFTDAIENNTYDLVSFDNDLGEEPVEGYELLKMMCGLILEKRWETNKPQHLPECIFHTKNPIAEKNMTAYWDNFVKNANHSAKTIE